ncbi:hypothetical protein RHSIM_Rhsim13G0141600 [Rhododendron simsii]|uniref:Transposase n=1 Tax=Rhododendron simsii TaxID=118357 RepID=A0A834G0R9_RHOSS|nr:hypothetical protein RHSIM_Rhsim13G0141600 [Rhododendron simsii]
MAMPPPRSRSPTPTGPTLPSSSVPTWESNSTSTEIESNEAQLPTLDSSQAETESNLPTNEPEELGYTSDGDKILSKEGHFKIYDVEKLKTMRLMERNKSRVSLTTDMWTSISKKRGFMVITAHIIDDSWKLQSRILSGSIVSGVDGYLLEWNINRKLSTLTVDNCTTNDAMIDLLLEKLGGDHIRCKSLFHVRCAAHILNLIVKDGLDVIKSSIVKVRDSVAYWTATQKREETFEGAARQLGITYGKNLSLDCPTRWNSTFLMLQTAIKYRNAFGRLKLKDPQYKSCPNDDDWNLAEEICERLEIFYKVTLLFSGTTYPTSNLFFPDVCDIKVKLSEWVCCGIDVVEEMALNMLEKYDKYWDNTHGFLAVAVVLDPRFKMSLIEYYYIRIYGDHGVGMAEDIRKRCYDLLTLYQGKSSSKDCSESSSKAPPSTYLRDRTSLSDYLDQRKKTKIVHVKSELDRYLEEEQLPMCDDFDILAWWKSNGLKYPVLQAIARDVLAVPVSTVASESSFSTSGRVVSPSRNRLHPKTLEALMCTQSWLAALENEEVPTINDEDMDVDDCMSDVTTVDD